MSNVTKAALGWEDDIHGAINLEDIEDFSISDDGSAAAVFNVTGNPIGAEFPPGAKTISLTERKKKSPQINWRRLRKEESEATLYVDEIGGELWAYRVVVSKIDSSSDNQSKHQRTIELIALEDTQLR